MARRVVLVADEPESFELETFNREEGGFDSEEERSLNDAMFRDVRWPRALEHLGAQGLGQEALVRLLERGAEAFGLWPGFGAQSLVPHLLQQSLAPSAAVSQCCGAVQLYRESTNVRGAVRRARPSRRSTFMPAASEREGAPVEEEPWWSGISASTSKILKGSIFLLASGASLAYGVLFVNELYPNVPSVLGWQVVISRATAMGMGILSSLLYLTMARAFLTWLSTSYASSKIFYLGAMCDAHKELHKFAGRLTAVYAFIHTIGHIIGTAPGLITHTAAELNAVFGCAMPDQKTGYIRVDLGFLAFPKCPITEANFTFVGVLFQTTPGVTGVLLWIVLLSMAWTARSKKRAANYDRFACVHTIGLLVWPLLLFWHGALGLVGFGVPFAVFFLALPLPIHLYDRLRWRCRRYVLGSRDVIRHATIRRSAVSGASLMKLDVDSRRVKQRHCAGMYAFLCFPEYSSLQWHPFTICSAQQENTVDFIIANAGDWTRALIGACEEFHDGSRLDFPTLILDGPYSAPTQRFSEAKVLVAVGTGVGITPFLAMLSHLIALLRREQQDEGEELTPRQAHLIWMTRNADEFLFGGKYLEALAGDPFMSDKVVLHLHVTGNAPDKHGPAYLFREAVRRQSALDRQTLKAELNGNLANGFKLRQRDTTFLAWRSIPWCWMAGVEHDVLWQRLTPQETGCARGRLGTVLFTNGDALGPTASMLGSEDAERGCDAACTVVPIAFGRPDFAKVIRSVSCQFPEEDVELYVCGNDAIVKSLQDICDDCSRRSRMAAQRDPAVRGQQFTLRYERFG